MYEIMINKFVEQLLDEVGGTGNGTIEIRRINSENQLEVGYAFYEGIPPVYQNGSPHWITTIDSDLFEPFTCRLSDLVEDSVIIKYNNSTIILTNE